MTSPMSEVPTLYNVGSVTDTKFGARLQGILDRITYKHNFWWSLRPTDQIYRVKLYLYMKVPDSTVPEWETESRITVQTTRLMDSILWESAPDALVIQYVFDAIRSLEMHEAQEWFKVDGVAVYDPHKEGK